MQLISARVQFFLARVRIVLAGMQLISARVRLFLARMQLFLARVRLFLARVRIIIADVRLEIVLLRSILSGMERSEMESKDGDEASRYSELRDSSLRDPSTPLRSAQDAPLRMTRYCVLNILPDDMVSR